MSVASSEVSSNSTLTSGYLSQQSSSLHSTSDNSKNNHNTLSLKLKRRWIDMSNHINDNEDTFAAGTAANQASSKQ